MNTGQTLLTIFAMCLLMTVTANIYRSTAANGQTILRSKCGLAAISIASSLIEEAQRKKFDEFTTHDSAANNISQLTLASSLGKESGETDNLDDFDDYNNYTRKYFEALPETIYASCKVSYVNISNPAVVTTTRTWHKLMTVSVTSPSLIDTIKQSFIYSYWYFR